MKQEKNHVRKLSFNKTVIAKLNQNHLEKVIGGNQFFAANYVLYTDGGELSATRPNCQTEPTERTK